MRWRVPLGFPAGLPDCPGRNRRPGPRLGFIAPALSAMEAHQCLWPTRLSHREQEETLGIGWRRHSELGPNLLMDNEANFAIFS
jgi:hypothetical protein